MSEEEQVRIARISVVLNRMRKAMQEHSFVVLSPDEVDDVFYALRALATPIVKRKSTATMNE